MITKYLDLLIFFQRKTIIGRKCLINTKAVSYFAIINTTYSSILKQILLVVILLKRTRLGLEASINKLVIYNKS